MCLSLPSLTTHGFIPNYNFSWTQIIRPDPGNELTEVQGLHKVPYTHKNQCRYFRPYQRNHRPCILLASGCGFQAAVHEVFRPKRRRRSFKPSPRKESISIQHCHEQIEIDVQGAGKMV
ncbi:hypothetical protein ARMGADRAFT_543658 [Armillaria gallica]|uniref:Uncharacterized protein n=1 Tax=Armillaria gallica TaxID=47427 RepID=A0A2H3D3D6_ARMGA|nr:hypothetical protein ARMGADRAFT_543658 [Armillaria gallica]